MDFAAFKDWAFLGLLGGGVWILYTLKVSVEHLNVKIAVLLERSSSHEMRILRLEKHR